MITIAVKIAGTRSLYYVHTDHLGIPYMIFLCQLYFGKYWEKCINLNKKIKYLMLQYRIFIVILMMISTIEFSQCQMSSIYSLNLSYLGKEKPVYKSCYLCFYENGDYEICIDEQLTSDMVNSFAISIFILTIPLFGLGNTKILELSNIF